MSDMPDYTHAVYTSVKNTWQDAENLDDTHGYITYIWIPEETYKVDLMKLHVYSEKFRAHSKSALAGGGTTKTSTAGGAYSHTVTGATSSSTTPTHTHTVTIGAETSSYTTPTHTHDVVIGTRTSGADTPHRHRMFGYNTAVPGGYAEHKYDGMNMYGSTLYIDLKKNSGDAMYTANPSANHTHNVSIGTVTSASGGGNHAHTIDYGTKTSASGGGSHNHTVSGQTAETVTNHTHDVTLPDHTHDIEFGIYEEAITGRTLSAILYDPDNNELEDFGVVLTGEDSDIIDLTDYFETLEYGMYKMVLSASGRLRARLVFYELCKMYAQY